MNLSPLASIRIARNHVISAARIYIKQESSFFQLFVDFHIDDFLEKCFSLYSGRIERAGPISLKRVAPRTNNAVRAFCHNHYDRRDGCPPVPASGKPEAVTLPVGGMFSGLDEWTGLLSDEKCSSSGRVIFFCMSMREGCSPDRKRSRAVCHKNHDRRDGFPAYSGLQ